jgi:hypothetical protein
MTYWVRSPLASGLRAFAAWLALAPLSAWAAPPEVYGYFRNSSLAGMLLPRDETVAATGPLDDLVFIPWNSDDALFASYEVDYGVVRVLADHGWPETQGGGFANAGATAGWTDRVTITAPGVTNGSVGSIVFRVRVEGSVASSGNGQACAIVSFGLGSQVTNCSFSGGAASGDGFGYFDSSPFTFLYGSPFDVSFEANADAGGFASVVGSARTDLSNTLTYEGVVEVLDASQQPVTTFAIASASGFDYAVPEPIAFALGLAAIAGLAGLAPFKQ